MEDRCLAVHAEVLTKKARQIAVGQKLQKLLKT
jgi:hypothetical protein